MGLEVGAETPYRLFAANQVMIAADEQDLSYMVRKLKEEHKRARLKINLSKCEYLAAGHDECKDLELENGVTKRVQLCKYLGSSLISREIVLIKSCTISRTERIRNEIIRQNNGIEKDIMEEVQRKQNSSDTQRMAQHRWPRKILEWTPREEKRGRPKRS
ncbi:hypothetical protein HUJ04_002960 [Dendroctonus ponderosae]|nr:hypothetical protein HUJ04_002960 [Dendroctonus ponderosae]